MNTGSKGHSNSSEASIHPDKSNFSSVLRSFAQKGEDTCTSIESNQLKSEQKPTESAAVSQSIGFKKGPLLHAYQSAVRIHSPPVVTIAPTQISTNKSKEDRRENLHSHWSQYTASTMHHPREPPDMRGGHDRPETSPRHELRTSTANAASMMFDSQSRGFQPYHHGDDPRSSFMIPYAAIDPVSTTPIGALPYSPFMSMPYQQQFRVDDPVLLERYRMMAPYLAGYPSHHSIPGLFPPMSPSLQQSLIVQAAASGGYPYELLAQQLQFQQQASLLSPRLLAEQHAQQQKSPITNHNIDRLLTPTDKRIMETRMLKLGSEREKERERQMSKERKEHERLQALKECISPRKEIKEDPDRYAFLKSNEHTFRESEQLMRMERELEKELERERERNKEKERRERLQREHGSPRKDMKDGMWHNPRFGSITQGTPREGIPSMFSSHDVPKSYNKVSKEQTNSGPYRPFEQIPSKHLPSSLKSSPHQISPLPSRDHATSATSNHLERSKDIKPTFYRPFEVHSPPKIHRPFEYLSSKQTESASPRQSHYSDYERSLMNEKILAQDRATLTAQSHALDLSCNKAPLNGLTRDQPKNCVQRKDGHIATSNIDSTNKKHSSNVVLSQYRYDRPVEYKENILHVGNTNKTSSVVNSDKSSTDQIGIEVSRLDIDERALREKRLNGDYSSDDDENEQEDENSENELSDIQKKWHRLQVISKMLIMTLDKAPDKMQFLQYFGLTTQKRKRAIKREQRAKKRRIYRETSVSPIEMEDNEPERLPQFDSQLSHELNKSPDATEKRLHLMTYGLQRISSSRRKEIDLIRKACDGDRVKRLNGTVCIGDNIKQSKGDHHSPNNKLKRKYEDILSIPKIHSGVMSSNSGVMSSHSGVMSSSRDLQQCISSQPPLLTKSPAKGSAGTVPTKANMAVIYPESRSNGMFTSWNSHPSGRHFAHEFHQSVLAETRHKTSNHEPNSQYPRISSLHSTYHPTNKTQMMHLNDRVSSSSRSKQHSSPIKQERGHTDINKQDNTHRHRNISEGDREASRRPSAPHIDNSAVMKWPGIEVLMEAYQRHVEELPNNRQSVNHIPQPRLHDKSREDEPLSLKMTDLVQPHLEADKKPSHLDSLQNYITNMR